MSLAPNDPSSHGVSFAAAFRVWLRVALLSFGGGTGCGEAGALARDVHAAWTRTIERHGLLKDSRCGYSIGLNYPPDWGERTISFRAIDETFCDFPRRLFVK
jgi:hypothetical protein